MSDNGSFVIPRIKSFSSKCFLAVAGAGFASAIAYGAAVRFARQLLRLCETPRSLKPAIHTTALNLITAKSESNTVFLVANSLLNEAWALAGTISRASIFPMDARGSTPPASIYGYDSEALHVEDPEILNASWPCEASNSFTSSFDGSNVYAMDNVNDLDTCLQTAMIETHADAGEEYDVGSSPTLKSDKPSSISSKRISGGVDCMIPALVQESRQEMLDAQSSRASDPESDDETADPEITPSLERCRSPDIKGKQATPTKAKAMAKEATKPKMPNLLRRSLQRLSHNVHLSRNRCSKQEESSKKRPLKELRRAFRMLKPKLNTRIKTRKCMTLPKVFGCYNTSLVNIEEFR